jgi:hypothetical protein
MRVAAALALVIAAATGCGHSARKPAAGGERQGLDRAIAAGRVAGAGGVEVGFHPGRPVLGAVARRRRSPPQALAGRLGVELLQSVVELDVQALDAQLVLLLAAPLVEVGVHRP